MYNFNPKATSNKLAWILSTYSKPIEQEEIEQWSEAIVRKRQLENVWIESRQYDNEIITKKEIEIY